MAAVTIAPGYWLNDDAARSYARMRAAGMPAGITSAGRTYAEQVAIFKARYSQVNTGRDYNRWDGKDWWRKNDGTPGYAAVPGTSAHESGLSLDLNDPARAWLIDHGDAHGWVRNVMPSEPWHFTYFTERDQRRNDPIPEDDMQLTDKITLGAEASEALGLKELSVGGALQLAASAGRQNRAQIAGLTGTVRALEKAVDALAAGTGVDPNAIKAAAKAGTKDALDEAQITVTLDTKP
jgi:hypothetical protein